MLDMKKLNILLGILLGLTLICCSADISTNNNSQKKLTKITYSYLDGQIRLVKNFVYDSDNNLIEINDANGLVSSSYTYNNANSLSKIVDYQYNDDQTNFEIIKNISYNSDSKISEIEELFNVYNSKDGTLNYQNYLIKKITYSDNNITIITDHYGGRTVDLTLSNNLITAVKIFRFGNLEADMVFTYDDEGNCISGSGPYQPGLYDTTDIDLNVTYGNQEKNPFFNIFFEFNILYNNNSFFNLKEVLVNQQGTRYPERIQWYQFENWNNKEINDYSFDRDGYIISNYTNVHNTNTYAEIINYTWE